MAYLNIVSIFCNGNLHYITIDRGCDFIIAFCVLKVIRALGLTMLAFCCFDVLDAKRTYTYLFVKFK